MSISKVHGYSEIHVAPIAKSSDTFRQLWSFTFETVHSYELRGILYVWEHPLLFFLYIDLRVLVLPFAQQRKKQWHHHCTLVQVAKSCQQISTENVDYLLEQHIRDENISN